jgi:hypothetical protein
MNNVTIDPRKILRGEDILMYLIWYERMRDKGDPILSSSENYTKLWREFHERLDKLVKSWDIPNEYEKIK